MDLPNGWITASWSDIVVIIHGQNQKDVADPNGTYPIYGSGGQIGKSNRYICKAGSTVVGRKGTINKPFFVPTDFWNIDTAFGITPQDCVLPKYLFVFCQHFNFTNLDRSTTIPSLTQKNLYGIQMPLPPLAEQHRIVAKIDALFSKLDKGVETLHTIRRQLRTYRQAVLKWAFEGEITNITLSQTQISDFIEKPRYGTSKKCLPNRGDVCVLRIPNINYNKGTIDYSDVKYATFDKEEKESLALRENDILMIRSNGSVSLVGRAALIRKHDEDNLFAGYLIRLRINSPLIISRYLLHYLSSSSARIYIERVAKSTSGVNNINAKEIESIPIPICSINEQMAIIAAIESRLSVCDKLEQIVDENLEKAAALRQSILKKAFAGKLVPQDTNDEPAEELLERLKAAKAAEKTSQRHRGAQRNNI